MKLSIGIEIKPFDVPGYVAIINGVSANSTPSLAINQLPKEVVVELCRKFTEDVFAKAGLAEEEV